MRLPLLDRLTAWAGVFYDDVEQLLEPALFAARRRRSIGTRICAASAGVDGASPLSRLLAANFHSYLHDDLLVKADRMSMANSLEARAPFLDRALIEYVAGLPDDYKLQRRARPRRSCARRLPIWCPSEVKRGAKRGFGVPLDALVPRRAARLRARHAAVALSACIASLRLAAVRPRAWSTIISPAPPITATGSGRC